MGTLNSRFPGGIPILSHDSGHTLLTHLEQLLINSSKYFPFYALPASRTPLTCVHLPRALPAEAGTTRLRAGKAGGEGQGGRDHAAEWDSLSPAPGRQWCLALGAKELEGVDTLGLSGMSAACRGIREKSLMLQG